MLRKVWAGIQNVVKSAYHSKIHVGTDLRGNKYYNLLDEENKWKRLVEFKDGKWEPNAVPQLWNLWLYYQRETPPTKQEELDLEEYQRVVSERAKKLEADDAALRKKELDTGRHTEQHQQETPDQFFVTWKRKVQQGDGSIDVNTNKKDKEDGE